MNLLAFLGLLALIGWVAFLVVCAEEVRDWVRAKTDRIRNPLSTFERLYGRGYDPDATWRIDYDPKEAP